MKNAISALPLLGALAAPAWAIDYTDEAEVISAVPIYQSVNEPRQHCWSEPVTTYEQPYRSGGGAIIGAITGGLLGNTVGRGHGRAASTAVGAAVGAVVGDRIDNQGRHAVPVTREVQRCQVVDNIRQVISGYQVTYRYNGRDTTVILPNDPGPRVRIGVGISGQSGVEVIPPAAPMVSGAARPVVQQITYVSHSPRPVFHHPPLPRVIISLHGDRHGHHRPGHRERWNRMEDHRGGHHDNRRDGHRGGRDRRD
jgi:uncharacterized protein YcfJ